MRSTRQPQSTQETLHSSGADLEISNNVPSLSPRGGASMITVDDQVIVMFGGANRQQQHFNTLHTCVSKGDGTWKKLTTTGDLPPPRSGQSMCQFGKYLFLYGGIDFENEAVYNDLYMLNTDTWEWKYVGESGEEIPARNSHILCVLHVNAIPYLVLFGGASPELGPLGDTFYAVLPQNGIPDEVQPKSLTESTTEFFVTWKRVTTDSLSPSSSSSPCPREMFSASILSHHPLSNSSLVISGGRTMDSILSDVWILSGTASPAAVEGKISGSDGENGSSEPQSDHATDPTAMTLSDQEVIFQWQQLPCYELPHPRCAHTSALIPIPSPPQELQEDQSPPPALFNLVLYGGFTGQGISDDLIQCVFDPSFPSTSPWQPVVSPQNIPGRFGHVMCLPPSWIRANSKKEQSADASKLSRRILLYGGIDAEQDYNDLWLISL